MKRSLLPVAIALVAGLSACDSDQPVPTTQEPPAPTISIPPPPVPIPFSPSPEPTPEPSNLGAYCAEYFAPMGASQIPFLTNLISMYSADGSPEGARNTAGLLSKEANKVADKMKKVATPSIMPESLADASTELFISLRTLGVTTSDPKILTIRIKALTGSVNRFHAACKGI